MNGNKLMYFIHLIINISITPNINQVILDTFQIKGKQSWKYIYFLSWWQWDEKIDATLVSVQ